MEKVTASEYKARFRRRSTHVPNLTDELSTAKERRLNRFGTALLVWCGKSVNFDRVFRTFLEFNLGLACSKRSDSGERCRVKKAMKSRGGLGREVRERL